MAADPPEAVTIRAMRDEDAWRSIEVHRAAVRRTAAADYPQSVINDWAPWPITADQETRLLANEGNEHRLVAEADGRIVGIGSLSIERGELVACYVDPDAGRRGVGTALVAAMERIAREGGVSVLTLNASITAERFYRTLGYAGRGDHEFVLPTGARMACVKMEKNLQAD